MNPSPPVGTLKMREPPKKPLSPYNIFFQYHRIKLLESPYTGRPLKIGEAEDRNCPPPGLEDVDPSSPLLSRDESQITEYRKDVIRKAIKENPFRVNTENRVHERTHGKMSFLDMSRHMGKKWRNSDATTKSIFRQLANEGKAQYNKSVCASYKKACSRFQTKENEINMVQSNQENVCDIHFYPTNITHTNTRQKNHMPNFASQESMNSKRPSKIFSFIDKKDDINNDELRKLLSELDWSRLGN